jgi:hypothetical protein
LCFVFPCLQLAFVWHHGFSRALCWQIPCVGRSPGFSGRPTLMTPPEARDTQPTMGGGCRRLWGSATTGASSMGTLNPRTSRIPRTSRARRCSTLGRRRYAQVCTSCTALAHPLLPHVGMKVGHKQLRCASVVFHVKHVCMLRRGTATAKRQGPGAGRD